jgi:hypothetical protein
MILMAEIFSDVPSGGDNFSNRTHFYNPNAANILRKTENLLRDLPAEQCPEPDTSELKRLYP